MIRVLIVDDHPITCDGLAEWLLMKDEGLEIVGKAYRGWEAEEKIERTLPDVVVLDWNLPDLKGTAIAEEIKLQDWPVKVLALSGYDDSATVRAMISAGAAGYILKGEKREMILDAIYTVARGEAWFSPSLVVPIMQQVVEEDTTLTEKELGVLQGLANGLTSKQIANQLQIGPRTVETHTQKIYKKLNAQNKGEAVRIAGEKGLLK